jgi:3-dehydroquinate synthase
MRGLNFGFVASSLLAQVDATVGGKNGVNFKGYKNMVGVFNQPQFVIADIDLLATLPAEEVACGLAEIVKHGCIADEHYFETIETHSEAISALEPAIMRTLVYGSVVIKADVVNQDEREAGVRRKLNFGHTIGHALEKTLGISHGAAVSIGMVMAADLSREKGLLPEKDAQRLNALLSRLGLPTQIAFDPAKVTEALGKDKKRESDRIKFVLLQGLGQSVITDIPLEELYHWVSRYARSHPDAAVRY